MERTTDNVCPDLSPVFTGPGLVDLARQAERAVHIVLDRTSTRIGLLAALDHPDSRPVDQRPYDIVGTLPSLRPESLGDRTFTRVHGARYPYVAGEMANGIATARMVISLAESGMLGFFGAGGLDEKSIARAIDEMQNALGDRRNWGVNLIHSPRDAEREGAITELLLSRDVPIVSASAFMGVTANVVRCSAAGLTTDRQNRIVRRRALFAKVSRPEVAEQFFSPAPAEVLRRLVDQRLLTPHEARLAASIPVAEDVTVEADSGGHTDNRPLSIVLPAVLEVRDAVVERYGFTGPIRVGAAGGLGTPAAVAGAFALGAAYVLTGSVNQVSVESGLAHEGKLLLGQADLADVTMAPAAGMFEMGVKLQVLQRGSMFGNRANMLYDLYRQFDSLESIPPLQRAKLERDVLRDSIESAWAATVEYWSQRDAAELVRAAREPKHRMALLFRSYLGQSSRWPITGDIVRRHDYQIWCGPAMGAFNRWTRGQFLGELENRTVVQIGRNLLHGAVVMTRLQQLRTHAVPLPNSAFSYASRWLE